MQHPYLRDNEPQHHQRILLVLLNQPCGCEENKNDVEAQNHGKQLRLQNGKLETLDDDGKEAAESTGGKCRGDLDDAVAPHLRVPKRLPDLVRAKLLVLDTRLVGPQSLNDQMLVLFTEALGSHRRVRHPDQNEYSPEDREAPVRQEKHLPRLEGFVAPYQGEAIGEKPSDDLLPAVHHVPASVSRSSIGSRRRWDSPKGHNCSLLFSLVPHGRENHKYGLAAGLKHTQQCPNNDQSGKVAADCV